MPSTRSATAFNLLTGLTLFASAVCAGAAVVLYVYPDAPVNPLPPARLAATTVPATSTVAHNEASATHTSTPTLSPTAAGSLAPTATHTLAPTTEPTLLPTALDVGFPFLLADAGVIATVSPKGCAWAGISGRVLDPLGDPIPNLPVQLGGSLGGKSISMEAMSNSAPAYGDGAFEFTLGDKPVPSENTLWIQLLDARREPISETIFLTTYEGCDRNLLVVDFRQRIPT